MFPKHIRLQLRQEKDFFKTAKRKNFPLFQVLYRPAEQTQFAVVVPKKVSLKATERHKILRRMRAILVAQQAGFESKQVVVVLFKTSLGKSFSVLNEMVNTAVQQLNS
ncbi:MAG: ribonuclease P protein component [Patescibacteria group bacterium]